MAYAACNVCLVLWCCHIRAIYACFTKAGRWAQGMTKAGRSAQAGAHKSLVISDAARHALLHPILQMQRATSSQRRAMRRHPPDNALTCYQEYTSHQKCGRILITKRSRHAASDAEMRRLRQRQHRRECCSSRHGIQQAPDIRAHTKTHTKAHTKGLSTQPCAISCKA
jgi:hypothetical protein